MRLGILAVFCAVLGAGGGPSAAAERPAMLPAAAHGDWAAIGRVNIVGYQSRGACTGTLIAPDLVLTAAHCTFRGKAPARPEDLRFAAGWFRGRTAAARVVRAVEIPLGWTPADEGTFAGVARDIAVLRLAEPIRGIAPLALTAAGPGLAPRILGYRFDRPHALTDYTGCGPPVIERGVIGMPCPVVHGTSGAPVLVDTGNGWRVVAVTVATVRGVVALAAPLPQGLGP